MFHCLVLQVIPANFSRFLQQLTMTNLPNLPTSASTLQDTSMHELIARYESLTARYDLTLPPSLLLELEAFAQRNRILASCNILTVPEEDVCPNCLKAHLLLHAPSHGLSSQEQEKLKRALPGKIGHGENYLDGTEVKRSLQ